MFRGVMIAESLRLGTRLEVPDLAVSRISRIEVAGATDQQQPTWSLIDFSCPHEAVEDFALALAEALDPAGHWYADLGDGRRHVVVFPGRVFDYSVGDTQARADAEEYGASIGIPVEQLDWTDQPG